MSASLSQDAMARGYADRLPTKAPNWHALVTLDVLFNNLSIGLFLIAGIGELAAPATFRALASLAYPLALVFLICDLVCLVLDLGDPRRFHHMLRVWKPSSPMSLGTWSLTAFAAPLTVLALMSFLPAGGPVFEGVRRLIIVLGLVPALAAATYKGVLFSTTAQPGWSRARWMGAYLINSTMALGTAELLLISAVIGAPDAVALLRSTLLLMLLLNLVALTLLALDLRPTLLRARPRGALIVTGASTVLAGLLVPLWLVASGTTGRMAAAVLLILAGAVAVRAEIVRLPHLMERSLTAGWRLSPGGTKRNVEGGDGAPPSRKTAGERRT